MKYITNIFKIENPSEISAQYRAFDIKGLKQGKDYQENKQFLIRKFSNSLRHPVTIVEINSEPKLIVKNDSTILSKIKTENEMGRLYFHLYLSDKVFDIDFVNPSDEVKKICLRFLQFDLNGELRRNSNLWQPGAGEPFFLKTPEIQDGIAIYKGFTFRVIELPSGGFGISIDATRKFASASPLPYYLTKEEFDKRYKKKTLIYQYKDWYEIKAMEFDDFNVGEYKIEGVSLIDFVRNAIPRPHAPELANLPNDSASLIYYGSNMSPMRVPAGLCYEVLDFQDTNNGAINRKSIIPPNIRFSEIMDFKRMFFISIKYGNAILKFSEKTLEVPNKVFNFPSFELGNNNIVSKGDFKPNELDLPSKIAKTRLHRLLNPEIGFYSKSPLPNQIIVLPRSVSDTKGEVFLNMVRGTVNTMYPNDNYAPHVIVYEDKFKLGTDYLEVGKQIVNAVKSNFSKTPPGYGFVMIPRLERKAKREHDKLGALIIRELKKVGINCSIIHDDTIRECFGYKNTPDGKVQYFIKPERQRKFEGYVRGVAINKVLLNSNKWPFVLNEPITSDLIIGIDVKHHTAGFTIIDKHGKNIRTETDETSNKEKLTSDQLKSWLYKIVKDEIQIDSKTKILNITIHRDGRLFDTELEGLLQGLKQLQDEMLLSCDAGINILEIPKSSLYSVRVFGLNYDTQKKKAFIENAPNGLNCYFNGEAFLCSTGKEFALHSGTSNLLNVKFAYGKMSHEDLLSDLFKLTTLAFTKPDDCSRVPLTIKMNDIKLSDAASEYDEDAYRQLEILKSELNIE
ncbi:MAG: hypothetical protein OJF59_000604 [Cytophagales bacterium]|jgi:hypothetical protein|nr:MAG: hypothetical protein OJF59_000604 [Cytophagales bacterium]